MTALDDAVAEIVQTADQMNERLTRLAAPPAPVAYDARTLDAVNATLRGLIQKTKFRETAATLNRAIAAVDKLRDAP